MIKISRVPDLNGISGLYNMLEIYQSDPEPSICTFISKKSDFVFLKKLKYSSMFKSQYIIRDIRLGESACIPAPADVFSPPSKLKYSIFHHLNLMSYI